MSYHRPDAAQRVTDLLIERFDDDIQERVVVALGHAGVEDAAPALGDLFETDPGEEVRTVTEALDRIDH